MKPWRNERFHFPPVTAAPDSCENLPSAGGWFLFIATLNKLYEPFSCSAWRLNLSTKPNISLESLPDGPSLRVHLVCVLSDQIHALILLQGGSGWHSRGHHELTWNNRPQHHSHSFYLASVAYRLYANISSKMSLIWDNQSKQRRASVWYEDIKQRTEKQLMPKSANVAHLLFFLHA